MAIRKEFITLAIGGARADPGLRAPVPARDHRDRPGRPSPATPTGRRSTSAASSSARRSSARTSRCRSTRTASRSCRMASRSRPRTRATSRRGRRERCRPTTTPPPRSPTTGRTARLPRRRSPSNIAAYIQLNGKYYPGGLTAAKVPVDAADTSASGVDPDISVANAHIQAYRIAAVRHLSLATVDRQISKYTAGRGLGFSGEPSVDVLELNLALNRL